MQKKVLKNGLTVIHKKRDSETVAIQILVKAGPILENDKIGGISHFIEHLLFETKKRKAQQLSAEIESLGGVINAFTAEEVTGFYVHIPKKYFKIGLDILSDVIQNPAFNKDYIETERKAIIEEIKLWNDDPKLHQWELFRKALFDKHPAGRSAFGTLESMKSITKEDLVNYYNKYYVPNNAIITVVGDVDDVFNEVEKKFNFAKKSVEIIELPEQGINKKTELIEKKNVDHTYFVLGYKIPTRKEKESYIFDIIENILGYGISSKLANEIRTKRGLAYQVSTDCLTSKNFGYFSVFLSTDKKNIPEIRKIIINEFNKLQELTEEEIKNAKRSIEGNFLIRNVDPVQLVTTINVWEFIKDSSLFDSYINEINKVTLNDVKKVAKQYLNQDYTITMIEQ